MAFEIDKKELSFSELKTKKAKRRSSKTKNEQLREMLDVCRGNQLRYKYVLTDSWFACTEVFHKSIKNNTGIAKSPTRTVRTQSNHFFLSIYAFFKLEMLMLKHHLNHFALKTKLYVQALQVSFRELEKLRKGAPA